GPAARDRERPRPDRRQRRPLRERVRPGAALPRDRRPEATGDGLPRAWLAVGAPRAGPRVRRLSQVVLLGAGSHLDQPALRDERHVTRTGEDAGGHLPPEPASLRSAQPVSPPRGGAPEAVAAHLLRRFPAVAAARRPAPRRLPAEVPRPRAVLR